MPPEVLSLVQTILEIQWIRYRYDRKNKKCWSWNCVGTKTATRQNFVWILLKNLKFLVFKVIFLSRNNIHSNVKFYNNTGNFNYALKWNDVYTKFWLRLKVWGKFLWVLIVSNCRSIIWNMLEKIKCIGEDGFWGYRSNYPEFMIENRGVSRCKIE